MENQKLAAEWMLSIERIGKEEEDTAVTKKTRRKSQNEHVTTANELGHILTEKKVQKWKVLIMDQFCFDVLGPLFKEGDLRSMGVTLFMNIDHKRQPIQDAPAIYFVKPTKENVEKICKDCENDLYESAYINFCGSNYKRELLDEMATLLVNSDSAHKINKVFDQYLNFHCVERDFFSLGLERSLFQLHDETQSDDAIKDQLDSIASGISSVALTMGATPLLAFARGSGPAAMVAERVEKRLRDAQKSKITNHAHHQQGLSDKNRRPIAIIVDRSVDYNVCLQHQWNYRPMVHDIFNMKLNKVKVPVKGEDVEYNIDFEDDIWNKNATEQFSRISVTIPEELNKLKSAMDEFNKKAGLDASDFDEAQQSKMNINKDMMQQVFKLSEERKRVNMHFDITVAILKEVRARKLDEFVSIEEGLIKAEKFDKQVLLSLLDANENEKGTLEDKIRLLLICYLCQLQKSDWNKIELEPYEAQLAQARHVLSNPVPATTTDNEQSTNNNDQAVQKLPELEFLRRMNAMHTLASSGAAGMQRVSSSNALPTQSSTTGSFANLAMSFGGSLIGEIAQGIQSINILNDRNFQLPLTRIVDAIVNNRPNKLMASEQFVITDPKMLPSQSQVRVMKNDNNGAQSGIGSGGSHTFNDVIVFVVGGGNYKEYQNLGEFFSQQRSRSDDHFGTKGHHFTYGCTDVVTGEEFLQQLYALGKK
ncbi:SLY1 [Acrasis kona]|uniref:SLY1 n=1 Tax=Acrasis kona TaxID=1008807 RepID=A0AAW2ZHH5_9EUKA